MIKCSNPYQLHPLGTRSREPIVLEATTTRPANSHMSGSPAAQHLCEACGIRYDTTMEKRQSANRKQRMEDVLKGKTHKYRQLTRRVAESEEQ